MEPRIKSTDKVDLLFIGNLQHNEEYAMYSARRKKHEPHTDEILFKKAVKVHMFRIVRSKRQIYKKYHSITQSQKPIKNFQIFFRNLSDSTCSRYSLLTKNDEMLANPNDDILITSKEGIYTDVIVVRGFFTKMTICVYGYLLKQQTIKQKCVNYGNDVRIEKGNNNSITSMIIDKTKSNIIARAEELESKMESVHKLNSQINMEYIQTWHEINNDDEINQTQIRHITNISENLQNTLIQLQNNRVLSTQTGFRTQLEELLANLSKLFRSRHLGLYYPSSFRTSQIISHLPEKLIRILLKCLVMCQSDQYRALQILRFLLQIERMAEIFVNNRGIQILVKLYFSLNSEQAFLTMKIFCLQVILVLAQYDFAAKQFVYNYIQDQKIYQMLSTKKKDEKEKQKDKNVDKQKKKQIIQQKQKSRSKSRDKKKKQKKSSRSISKKDKKSREKDKKNRDKSKNKDKKKKKSEDSDSSDSRTQKKKDKKSKKDRDRSRSKSKEKKDKKQRKDKKDNKERSRTRSKDKKDKQKQKKQKKKQKQRQKQKQKKKQQQKEKEKQKEKQSLKQKKQMEIQKTETRRMTFYQILLVYFRKDYPYKQSFLIKLLIEQITHTIVKTKDLSEQIAIYSPLLRQTRFLFTPSRQLVNNKTLKLFSTYQPSLNVYQSKQVQDCNYVSDVVKLKYPQKYELNIRLYQTMNLINKKIIKNDYNEEFILLMSQLLLAQQNVFLGINRLVQAIKSPNIKKNQAVLITLYEYIYKILLQDDGMITVLYIDQIYIALLNITKTIKQQRLQYSKQLARSTKFLLNYIIVYDYFQKQNILKALSEGFLKIFKYIHIEASKFLEYENISNHHPLEFSVLKQNFNLGNFFELLPEQPLLQIDVSLKIFIVLCKYNKNIWTNYYECKLTNGFAVLLNKIAYLLIFFLRKNIHMQYVSSQINHRQKLIDNYVSVVTKLLILFNEKIKYQSGFNQLSPQDTFQDVEVYTICLDLFEQVLNAYLDSEIRVNCKKKLKKILILITQIYGHICQGVELTKNKTRQRKLKAIIQRIYILFFQKISARVQVLNLYIIMASVSKNYANEFVNNAFLSKFQFQTDIYDKQLSLLPKNQRTIFQNIFRNCVYRTDYKLKNSLVQLCNTLLGHLHYNTSLAIFRMLQNILKEHVQQLKNHSNIIQKSNDFFYKIILEKNVLFLDVLQKVMDPTLKNMILSYKTEEHLYKLLKHIEEQRQLFVSKKEFSSNQKKYYLLLIKMRNILLKIFIHLFNSQETMIVNTITLGFDIPDISLHKNVFKYLNQFSQSMPQIFGAVWLAETQLDNNRIGFLYDQEILMQLLNSILFSLKICISTSKCIPSQTILLYGDYIENAYIPQCLINLRYLIQRLLALKQQKKENFESSKPKKLLYEIFESTIYLLISLTQIPKKGKLNCDRRKTAIKSLLGLQFDIEDFSRVEFLNILYTKFLVQYFNQISQPEIKIQKEKQISKDIHQVFTSYKEKTSQKSNRNNFIKTYENYSSTLFSIITQGEEIAKARYRLVCNEWIGGDIKNLFKPLSHTNSQNLMNTLLQNLSNPKENLQLQYYPIDKTRTNIQFNQLHILHAKKQYSQRSKRMGQSSILLKHIPNQLKAPVLQQPRQNIKVLPTSTNIYSKSFYSTTQSTPPPPPPPNNFYPPPPPPQSIQSFNNANNPTLPKKYITPSPPVQISNNPPIQNIPNIPITNIPPISNIPPIAPNVQQNINPPITNYNYNDYMHYYQPHQHQQPQHSNTMMPNYNANYGMGGYNTMNTNALNPNIKKIHNEYEYMMMQQQYQQQQQMHQYNQSKVQQQQQMYDPKQVMRMVMDIILNIKKAPDQQTRQRLSKELQRMIKSNPWVKDEITRKFK